MQSSLVIWNHRPTVTAGRLWPTHVAQAARRLRYSKRAVGGWWQGSFHLSQEDFTRPEMMDFYNWAIGCVVRDFPHGIPAFGGLITEMRYLQEGGEFFQSLDPRWFHNRVKSIYSFPTVSDDEQGALAYDPGGNDAFKDEGQDFGEWEVAEGNAVYRISVTNTDGTMAWGYLGAAFQTTNPDDSIYVYEEMELTTAGWSGDNTGTPSTYEVRHIALLGPRREIAWSENTDSSSIFGECNHIVLNAGVSTAGATAARDRHLTEYAWPRSREIGGESFATGTKHIGPDRIDITVSGFWHTLNWRYQEATMTGTATALITSLMGAAQFVRAGRIEANTSVRTVECESIPQRLGDLCAAIIAQGDDSGNVWQGGVYNDRYFRFEAAPTTWTYQKRGAEILDQASSPAILPLVDPGFLMLNAAAPSGWARPGTSSDWDDPRIRYVDEVEYIRGENGEPDELRCHYQNEPGGVASLMQRIRRGNVT